jgi:hypothetical protein
MPTRCYVTNPGWMLLTYLWLQQFQTSQWLDVSLWVKAEKQTVYFGWCPYCKWTHQIHTNHDPGIQCQILLFSVGSHISCIFAPSLSFDILDKWNINNQCSTSCVRPGHVMVFLMVFSVLVCPGWSKHSWYQDSTLCGLSQWLRNVDLFFVTKKIIPFNMLYWVMRLG